MKTQILKYLSCKYNEEFVIVSEIKRCFGMNVDRYAVKKETEELFIVEVSYENGIVFRDSYFSVFILPFYKETVNSIINNTISDYKFTIKLDYETVNPDSLTKKVSVVDIHKYISKDDSFQSEIEINSKNLTGIEILNILDEISKLKLISKITFNNEKIYFIDYDYKINEITPPYTLFANYETRELETFEIERLCSVVYLDSLINNSDLKTLGNIIDYIQKFGIATSGKYPASMSKKDWYNLLSDIKAQNSISQLEIVKLVDFNEFNSYENPDLIGHRAVCFMDKDGRTYIIFRGTSCDKEWFDNANGMISSDTPAQTAALKFVTDIREDKALNIKYLVVAGHSKGGNKAQYAAITAPDNYVDRCVSLDGQGFSNEFTAKYKKEIEDRKSKIELISEHRDFVNCLGNYVKDNLYYRGRRGDYSDDLPHGYPLLYFHCPDGLRNKYNEIGDKKEFGYISVMLNQLVLFFLNDERYKNIKKSTAIDLINLLMENKSATPKEIAAAIKNLLIIFLDLTANSKTFSDSIFDVIYNESDVLIATALYIKKAEEHKLDCVNAQDSIITLVIKMLVSELIFDNYNRKCFIETIKKLISLMGKLKNDFENVEVIRNYIISVIIEALNSLKESVKGKIEKSIISGLVFVIEKIYSRKSNFNLSTDYISEEKEIFEKLDNWLDNIEESNKNLH